MSERPYPWTALIEALGEARLAEVRAALEAGKKDRFDRDLFLLDAAVGRLLRDLVPADAPAEAVTSYAALLHMLYLHWDAGSPVRVLERAKAAALLVAPPPSLPPATAAPAVASPPVSYVQLPERLVWAAPAPGGPHEPMDGAFVVLAPRRLRVLAVLGFRPERQGFSTIEAEAPLPPLPSPPPVRDDGTAPFATVLPAGERMGYFSVTTEAELALLALLALAATAG